MTNMCRIRVGVCSSKLLGVLWAMVCVIIVTTRATQHDRPVYEYDSVPVCISVSSAKTCCLGAANISGIGVSA